jgi:hypothetical protein
MEPRRLMYTIERRDDVAHMIVTFVQDGSHAYHQ